MTSKNVAAREIRAAAASVVGARSMGITTAACEAAPALLARAEETLESMLARAAGMGPSAPSMSAEGRYTAAAYAAAAYAAAIDELRAALGLETHAAVAAAAREVRDQAARDSAEISAAEESSMQAAIDAANQAARTAACDAMSRLVVDGRGRRVCITSRSSYSEGRMSSLGGWNAGGDVMARGMVMTAEDGRDVTGEVVATVEGEFRLEQPYCRSYPNGGETWHGGGLVPVASTATSEWLPAGSRVPEWRSESRVAADWTAADLARADDAMITDLAAMPEAWLQERANLVAAFAGDPDSAYGGQSGRKYSVRSELRTDLVEYQAAQRAAEAEKSARVASSPFAALAALRGSL